MILGCHLHEDANAHREDEIQAAWATMVEVAYAQGLDEAFKAAQQGDEDADEGLIRRAFMVPWFIDGFVLNPPSSAAVQPRYAEHLVKLDLAPVRAASERAKALRAEILSERDALRRRDVPGLDDLYMASVPPAGLSHSVVRHHDGRPRPVFHATPTCGFEAFLPVSHFGSALTVSRHAYNLLNQAPFEHLDVHACWLDIRHPLVLEDEGSMASTWLISKAQKARAIDIEEMKWITGHPDPLGLGEYPRIEASSHPRRTMLDNLAVVLLDKGYDGIRYDNAIEGGGASWVNLRSDQVIVDRVMRFGIGEGCFEPMEPLATSTP